MVDKNLKLEEARYFFLGCENYLRRERNNFNWDLIKLNIERYNLRKGKGNIFKIGKRKKKKIQQKNKTSFVKMQHKKSICNL